MTDENEKKPAPREPWNQIHQDLQGALETWTEISEKSQGQADPEQEKLEDMRRLLADLKSRMRAFEAL